MVRVENKSDRRRRAGEIAISVMRPRILGNPFRLGRDGDRDRVVMLHKRWLWTQMKSGTAVAKELRRIADLVKQGKDVVLICCCKPLACHGDNLAAAIEWMTRN